MPAGLLVRHAVAQAMKMVGGVACEHQIGMCHCPYERFQEPNSRWSPSLIALLASTSTREGASILEASLIHHFECTAVNIAHNRNWKTSSAYSCEGPNRDSEAHEHFVYIAVKPVKEWAAAASAHPPEEFGDTTRNRNGTSPSWFAVDGFGRQLLDDGWGLA